LPRCCKVPTAKPQACKEKPQAFKEKPQAFKEKPQAFKQVKTVAAGHWCGTCPVSGMVRTSVRLLFASALLAFCTTGCANRDNKPGPEGSPTPGASRGTGQGASGVYQGNSGKPNEKAMESQPGTKPAEPRTDTGSGVPPDKPGSGTEASGSPKPRP